MTKTPINYSNSSIYKIVCKDIDIKDCYVGSTTNLIKRKHQHKNNCNNVNGKGYNYYVYRFIRDHGGFDNWDIILIEKFDCKTKEELHRKERFYLETLGATLNKFIPTRTQKEYYEKNKDEINEKKKIYYQNNKDEIREKQKIYKQNNKDKIRDIDKIYQQINKDKIRDRKKIYQQINKDEIKKYKKIHYENNKDKISEKAKIKMTCECGSVFRKWAKERHYKSIKHKDYLKTIEV